MKIPIVILVVLNSLANLWFSWIGWAGGVVFAGILGGIGVLLSLLLLKAKNWARWAVMTHFVFCLMQVYLPICVAALSGDKFAGVGVVLYAPAIPLQGIVFLCLVFFGNRMFPRSGNGHKDETNATPPRVVTLYVVLAPILYGLANIFLGNWFDEVFDYALDSLWLSLFSIFLGVFLISGRRAVRKIAFACAWIFFIVSIFEVLWAPTASPLSRTIIPLFFAGSAALYLLALKRSES